MQFFDVDAAWLQIKTSNQS